MPKKLKILSDFTREGTQVLVDGEDLTASHHLMEVMFHAMAWGNDVRFEYTVQEPYTNENGEEQGETTVKYSYQNGEWMHSPDMTKGPPHLGKGDMADAKVGGRVLEDVSGASKVNRLILKDKRGK